MEKTGVRSIFSGAKATALAALGLCEFVRGALLFFILPIYVRGVLGMTSATVGYAMAAHYTLDTGLRSPSGWLTDRFGQRRVVLVALIVGWCGLFFVWRAHRAWMVVLGSALLGVGMSAIWPAVIARVTRALPPASEATAMGGVMMAWLTGVGAGTVSMGWLLGEHVRRGFSLLLAVWAAATGIAAVVLNQRPVAEAHHRLHPREVWRELVRIRLLLPGTFVQTFAMGVLMPVLVLYTHFELGYSGRLYSELLVAGGAATVLFQIPVGRLVDRFGFRPFLSGGFVVCAVMLAALVNVRPLWAVVLCAAGLGVGYASVLPAWNAVLANTVSEERRAVMWGIFMTVEGLGMAVGPLVGGRLWDGVGPSAPFWTASVILFGMAVFYGFAPLERLFHRSEQPLAAEDLREVL
ncbi:MFS transporter [Alicyclobacillus sp.]|uniref:MFS transporter n=1 Tax=Alicyclobacillus sp. TaxID=61169 RepID=UPI0025B7E8D2|nr:MFS transporter [Alicyclobacillus sp.]MCL6516055.1 MFS transporter [Alicyclobacillus sp.]